MDASDNYCPHCQRDSTLLINEQEGVIECTNCGVVVEDHLIDQREETKRFWIEGKQFVGVDHSRTGAIRNDLLDDGGLAVDILNNVTNNAAIRKNPVTDFLDVSEKLLLKGFRLINQWGDLMNIQRSVLMKVEEQLAKVEKDPKPLRGLSLESIVAATLYLVCQESSIPLKSHDVETTTGVPLKDLKRAYRTIKKILAKSKSIPTDPPGFCQDYCEKMKLPKEISIEARRIAEKLENKKLLDGRDPEIIAATAIYAAYQLSLNSRNLPMSDLSEHSKYTESDIKNSYQDIVPFLKDLMPQTKEELADLAYERKYSLDEETDLFQTTVG